MVHKRNKQPLKTYGKRQRRFIPFNEFGDDNMSWLPKAEDIDTSQKPPPLPPNKPKSQKAATMPVEPDEGKILMLMEVTGLDRNNAARYLRVCDGSLSC
jgi:hypothetical protein